MSIETGISYNRLTVSTQDPDEGVILRHHLMRPLLDDWRRLKLRVLLANRHHPSFRTFRASVRGKAR